ncbi:thiamine pyridinylase [Paenibacillus melissococcoides]|uniref:Thiamine pyridinylase n=1 Tax=Paenibacillus melissococcoides TaxID=2912268 RepID=A0ABM9GA40_9BACL|nr:MULTISPECIES: thiamine pyridinylase [Paenibacillus]MEB9892428.1 thiamine pyridinylase [Bacillus cereus]CAH8248941.1 thiamine pyridinylase [Paenibacillus melissococcoides]CAH8720811.1 thiamine pyridinylase [Paenibacillus melissococcoides]CAH8720855.1 thiamine pyridinylase [Paenibacillus melissococcoides]GIO80540.1 thiamine pyridinylase [Paenibacillus dendritiformis]
MSKVKGFIYKPLMVMLALLLIVVSPAGAGAAHSDASSDITLKVAVYPYVPDPARFQAAVLNQWQRQEPGVKLEFTDWDSYSSDPPEDLDVFVLDSIFLSDFVDAGYLLPFGSQDIDQAGDVIPFALQGAKRNGKVYGLPQILCTNLLFYRNGDLKLGQVDNIYELYKKIGANPTEQIPPPKHKGLLINMAGGTTKASMYLEALIDVTGQYTEYDILPRLDPLNDKVIRGLRLLIDMAGEKPSQYVPEDGDAYVRASWFEQGSGRAFVGYSESMMRMGDYTEQVRFKPISSSAGQDIPLFYSDVVSVNSRTAHPELAQKLANVMASADTVEQALRPQADGQYPQYLLPARHQVYKALMQDYPIYSELARIVNNPSNRVFRLGPEVRTWLKDAKRVLPEALGLTDVSSLAS